MALFLGGNHFCRSSEKDVIISVKDLDDGLAGLHNKYPSAIINWFSHVRNVWSVFHYNNIMVFLPA